MVLIPQAAPGLRFARFREAIESRVLSVLRGSQYILGAEVERFETDFAAFLGVRHCVGVNSGTDAMMLALGALDIGAGDEVLTVSLTAAGTVMPVLHVNATPQFIDINPKTRCIDLDLIEAAITQRSAVILPVHLHGFPVDMPRLMEIARRHKLAVIEDCAQAHGARTGGRFVGTFGDAAIFSFYPTKNLGCAGDGGAVVTNDDKVAARVRALRELGWQDRRRISADLGYNSRLDELQAAVLNALLPHLDDYNQERVAVADEYRRLLDGSFFELPPAHCGAVYHQFAVAASRRDLLRAELKSRAGMDTAVHYETPLHRQPLFAPFASRPLPATEMLAETMISLPIQPEVVSGKIAYIVEAFAKASMRCRA
jgi:dTDP-4-amino-4,6-dideoxygalactose transaminase